MGTLIKNIDEIKVLFPDEWVLIGDPKMDESELHVLSGIPILHSKDKKEVCYLGKRKVDEYQTITLIYTGAINAARTLTGIFNGSKK
jgi:hypothetical protein